MKKKKMIELTNYETGKEIYLAPDTDIVAISRLEATTDHKERTAVKCRNGCVYLVGESAKAVCELFGWQIVQTAKRKKKE